MSLVIVATLLGLLILLHELGHLLAARWAGIPIARFSVGFGPTLVCFRRGETEYRLAAFPLAGYVVPDVEDEQALCAIPLRRRIVYFLGGPMANALVAVAGSSLLNAFTAGLTVEAVLLAPWVQTGEAMAMIVAAIPKLFTAPEAMSGVVGIVADGGHFVGLSPSRGLQLTIMLSLSLAVLNLLPLPILDGGQVLFHALRTAFPRAAAWHGPLVVASAVVLIGLMIFVTVMDISRLTT